MCPGCPLVLHLPTAGTERSSRTAQAYPCLGGVLIQTHGKMGCVQQPVLKGGISFGCKWCLAVDPGVYWLLGHVLRSYVQVEKNIVIP